MTARSGEQPLTHNSEQPPSHPTHQDGQASANDHPLDGLVIHDLLNSMTGVLGQLELIDDLAGVKLDNATRQRLMDCLTNARDLSDMLVDLRFLAQIRAGETPRQPTYVPVTQLLQSIQNETCWPGNGTVTIDTASSHAQLRVRDDGTLAQRALHVTIRAALRLSAPPHATITADCDENSHTRITCRYVGTTLPEPLQNALWTPGVASIQRQYGCRVDRARAMELVRCIMQHLAGTARYEPTADGGMFILTFSQPDNP